MATPRAAEHRDLEQRFRKLERQVRQLVAKALSRETLAVTSGDFTVSGGGDVVVQDGGSIIARYPTGEAAVILGGVDLTGDGLPDGTQLQVLEEDGTSNVFTLYRVPPQDAAPDGISTLQVAVDTLNLVSRGSVLLSGDGTVITLDASGALVDSPLTAFAGLTVNNSIDYLGAPTTSAAANMNYNGVNGRLRVVTSSRRYKQDVADAPDAVDAILSVSGRTWRDRAEVAKNPTTDARYVGFIAEELHDAGLTDYIVYDDEGRPDAIEYDRLAVPLLELCKRQQAQIDDLTTRLERLERKASQ